MSTSVKRAFKYRFYPTEEQAVALSRTFGCVRLVYNKALDVRTGAWQQEQRRVGYPETSDLLTRWKKTEELSFLNEVSSVPLQQGLRHLQTAFNRFFTTRTNYPRYKSKRKSRAAAEYTRSGFRYRDGHVTLAKMTEPLNIRWSRPLPEGTSPTTITVSRDSAGRWHCSIVVESVLESLSSATSWVGVDMGLTSLATLSTGEKFANLRHERRDRARLAKAQRSLARKQLGSNNRAKARRVVARVHARIKDRRRDALHKLTTRLVRENQAIVIEDLAVRNMVRNRALARAIHDASWSEMRFMLEYKSEWYGRTLIAVNRWLPSSKTCSTCGHVVNKLPLHVREWNCPECGTALDRDVNAALNILAAGRAVAACGDGVRPARPVSVRHPSKPLFGEKKQEPSGANPTSFPASAAGRTSTRTPPGRSSGGQ